MILLVMCILLSGISMNGQTNKGNIFLAGSSNLGSYFGKAKYKTTDTKEDLSKYSSINLDARAGYFVIDNLVAGLFLDLEYYRNKRIQYDVIYSQSSFTIGPFARYYFLDLEKFKPFGHAQVGLGSSCNKTSYSGNESKDKAFYFSYLLGAGADFFLNERVALDLLMGYEHEMYRYKYQEGGERANDSEKYIYNSFVVSLGILVILGKN